ncbi:MAG TPA: hypothetical protein VEM14_04960, partial [Gemmatimonadaceae bacterium]|nr:hypothetical protein [Gemmatimonadaceae bacterium]
APAPTVWDRRDRHVRRVDPLARGAPAEADVVKQKAIHGLLEVAIDWCEDVANLVETIVVKQRSQPARDSMPQPTSDVAQLHCCNIHGRANTRAGDG